MHLDLNSLGKSQQLKSSVCIIGAGAAGISLALELEKKKISVLLLEAGDLKPTRRSQEVYRGTDDGFQFNQNKDHLFRSRLRYLGGTTNHWTGWCLEYEEDDFLKKDWVPASGWPLSKKDLLSYYQKARTLCDLSPLEPENPLNADFSSPSTLGFLTRTFQLSPPTRFGKKYFETLKNSSHVQVFTNAYVTEICSDASESYIKCLKLMNLNKTHFHVKADSYVLATGGFENARLLLVSNKINKKGLGNSKDLVGRYYMEHPETSAQAYLTRSPGPFHETYNKISWEQNQKSGSSIFPALVPHFSLRKKHKLLNSAFLLIPSKQSGKHIIPSQLQKILHKPDLNEKDIDVIVKTEQAPNYHSRVSLIEERDEWGIPRLNHHLQFSAIDYDSIKRSFKLFSRNLGFLDYGRFRKIFDHNWMQESRIWGHPCGTTRMSATPADGVVDKNCKLHGVSNLFVLGSSTFPTAGFVNPTLTIVAFSLRLADHLTQISQSSNPTDAKEQVHVSG